MHDATFDRKCVICVRKKKKRDAGICVGGILECKVYKCVCHTNKICSKILENAKRKKIKFKPRQ